MRILFIAVFLLMPCKVLSQGMARFGQDDRATYQNRYPSGESNHDSLSKLWMVVPGNLGKIKPVYEPTGPWRKR